MGLEGEEEAMESFIKAVQMDSWLWCAWLEVSKLVSSLEQARIL
jgi:hypothetical protein